MNKYSKLCLGLLLLLSCSHLLAQTPQKRVELMKYAIKMESSLPHETIWEVSWFDNFSLIEEAYAYKEGETCLILGFKSHYKNGKCRLANAEGIKDYKRQCSGENLPCNPQIFGKASADKPFCVSQKSGSELSKSCAKETFSHLAKKTKARELKDIPSMSLGKFDLNKVNLSKMAPEFSKEFDAIFNHDDASLDSAILFTEGLCEDLKASTQSGHQPLDLKVCESHLALLKEGKVPSNKQEKQINGEVVEQKVETDKVVVSTKLLPADEECIEPILDKQIEKNIKVLKKVIDQSDSAAWLSCVNKLEAHKVVAKQLTGIADFNKERDRYYGYWHQLNDEKQFGRLCENGSTEDNAFFSFLGPKGFSMVNVPASNIKNNISRVSLNGREYYIVRDMLGDYFELIAKDNVLSAPKEAQEDIRVFLKKGGGAIDRITPVPEAKLADAKVCIRERLDEYLDWITYPIGILPSSKDYNKDIGLLNASHSNPQIKADLVSRYSRSVEEIKKEQFAQVLKDVPDCRDILSEDAFSKQYDKDHADRIRLYLKFRGYLNQQ